MGSNAMSVVYELWMSIHNLFLFFFQDSLFFNCTVN